MPNQSEDSDLIFLNIAGEISKQSKCVKHKVGSIITRKGRIISTGYNGTPSGFINCNEHFNKDNFSSVEHREWSKRFEIHSEINAIVFAGKENVNIEGTVLYCTLQPCHTCLLTIIAAGINTVIYKDYHKSNNYDGDTDKLIKRCGLNVLHYHSELYLQLLGSRTSKQDNKSIWDTKESI